MFKREEYPKRLGDIGLTKEQIDKLRAVLEEMMAAAARRNSDYWDGKTDGINAVDRFLRGDMDAHDEFEDE